MTQPEIRACETCGRERPVYVYALPGIPMSVGNCEECLTEGAYPLAIAQANTETIGGPDQAARWWKESVTWKDGRYMTIEEALR